MIGSARVGYDNACYRQQRVDGNVKPLRLTCFAGLLLLSNALTATAQQDKPRERKPCQEHSAGCGIIVTFNPPLEDPEGTALLVPNEVTVDVPVELQATQVVVSSYPRGTGVADIPSERFVAMYRFKKVGKYARFRGEIKKCTDQGSLQVLVYCKGFERYPVDAGVGGAIDCVEVGPEAAH